MTEDDIRSEKEILRNQHDAATARLAALYVRSRRIGEVLQLFQGLIDDVVKGSVEVDRLERDMDRLRVPYRHFSDR